MKENNEWWKYVQPGHHVKCLDKSPRIGQCIGSGFYPNKKFIVKQIDLYEKDTILWPSDNGHGVFHDECKPDYQIGDWVIGWHMAGIKYKDKAWKIIAMPDGYLSPEIGYSTDVCDVRYASMEEVDIAVYRNHKFKIGDKVNVPMNNNYVCDFSNFDVPAELIKHGNIEPMKNTDFTIIDVFDKKCIVGFIDKYGVTVQLAFYTKDLIFIESKEKKSLSKNSLIKGEIYKVTIPEDGTFAITTYEGIADEYRIKGVCLSNMNNKNEFSACDLYITNRYVEFASKDDAHWLRVCIEADKFIDKNIALNTELGFSKFMPGKWYEWKYETSHLEGFWLCKCNKYVDSDTDKLHYSERINRSGKHVYRNDKCNHEQMVEISLDKIQQYLPSGHPDKFIKTVDTGIVSLIQENVDAFITSDIVLEKDYKVIVEIENNLFKRPIEFDESVLTRNIFKENTKNINYFIKQVEI